MLIPCRACGSPHSAGVPPPEPGNLPTCTLWPERRRAVCVEPVLLRSAQSSAAAPSLTSGPGSAQTPATEKEARPTMNKAVRGGKHCFALAII